MDTPNDTPGIRTVELDEPIKQGDTVIGILQLRKPGAGELRGLSLARLGQLDVDEIRKLLPRITMPTLTVADVDKLCSADLFEIAGEMADFLLTKRRRTEASSQLQ